MPWRDSQGGCSPAAKLAAAGQGNLAQITAPERCVYATGGSYRRAASSTQANVGSVGAVTSQRSMFIFSAF